MPSPAPMPMRAIPTELTVVQELPVARETTEQMSRDAARKMLGDRSLRP